MFSLICVWINGWVNNREAGDLRRHRGHYDVNVMDACVLMIPSPPHDYPYYWVILYPKSKEDKVKVTNLNNSPKFYCFFFIWNKHYTRHTFLSCLTRCANMKWIRQVLSKIQSGHDSVHRRTDGQGETSIPSFQLRWSGWYKKYNISTTNRNNFKTYSLSVDTWNWSYAFFLLIEAWTKWTTFSMWHSTFISLKASFCNLLKL